MKYSAIVIGASSGGFKSLMRLFGFFPANFPVPVIVVLHISPQSDSLWLKMLEDEVSLPVKEADEKENILPGVIYTAPPDYHLLVEKNHTFSLDASERVNFARPAIDVLFESAAEAYREKLIGIVLTGSNQDGAIGLKRIKELGGLTVVQDPLTAESSQMPAAAIKVAAPHHVLPLDEMAALLLNSV